MDFISFDRLYPRPRSASMDRNLQQGGAGNPDPINVVRVVNHVTEVRDTAPLRGIKEFDPSVHDMNEWIEKFERALRLGCVKDDQYVDWLQFTIGDVGIAAVDNWNTSYNVILAKLRKEFRMDRRSLEAQAKLRNMTKGDLSWEKFCAKVKQVAAIASEGSAKMKEFLTIQILTNNMDIELREKVMNAEHTEASQVLRRIAQVEAMSGNAVCKLKKTEEEENWKNDKFKLEEKLKELENRIEEQKISKIGQEVKNGQPRCWECNQIGHIRRSCPNRTQSRTNKFLPVMGPMQFYENNSYGHPMYGQYPMYYTPQQQSTPINVRPINNNNALN